MDEAVKAWRDSGEYLPPIMRDFHDQKEIFKTVHAMTAVDKHEYARKVDWVAGQCYVIDIFLWFMARHGYTLQRSRKPLNYADLQAHIEARRERDSKAFASALGLTPVQESSSGDNHDG